MVNKFKKEDTFETKEDLISASKADIKEKIRSKGKSIARHLQEKNPQTEDKAVRVVKEKDFNEENKEKINDTIKNVAPVTEYVEKVNNETSKMVREAKDSNANDKEVVDTVAALGIDNSPLVKPTTPAWKKFENAESKEDKEEALIEVRDKQTKEFDKRIASKGDSYKGKDFGKFKARAGKTFARGFVKYNNTRKFQNSKLGLFELLKMKNVAEYPWNVDNKEVAFDDALKDFYTLEQANQDPISNLGYIQTAVKNLIVYKEGLKKFKDNTNLTNLLGSFTFNTGDTYWYYQTMDNKFKMVINPLKEVEKEIKNVEKLIAQLEQFEALNKQVLDTVAVVSHMDTFFPESTFVESANRMDSVEDIQQYISEAYGKVEIDLHAKKLLTNNKPVTVTANTIGLSEKVTTFTEGSDFKLSGESGAIVHISKVRNYSKTDDLETYPLFFTKIKKNKADVYKDEYQLQDDITFPVYEIASKAEELDTYIIYKIGKNHHFPKKLLSNETLKDDSMFLIRGKTIAIDNQEWLAIKVEHGTMGLSRKFVHDNFFYDKAADDDSDVVSSFIDKLKDVNSLFADTFDMNAVKKIAGVRAFDNLSLISTSYATIRHYTSIGQSEVLMENFGALIDSHIINADPKEISDVWTTIDEILKDASLNTDNNVVDAIQTIYKGIKKADIKAILRDLMMSSSGRPLNFDDKRIMKQIKEAHATLTFGKMHKDHKWFFNSMDDTAIEELDRALEGVNFGLRAPLDVLIGDITSVSLINRDGTKTAIKNSSAKSIVGAPSVHSDGIARTSIHAHMLNEFIELEHGEDTLGQANPQKLELPSMRYEQNPMTNSMKIAEMYGIRVIDVPTLFNMAISSGIYKSTTTPINRDMAIKFNERLGSCSLSELLQLKVIFMILTIKMKSIKPYLIRSFYGGLKYNKVPGMNTESDAANFVKTISMLLDEHSMWNNTHEIPTSIAETQKDIERYVESNVDQLITEGSTGNREVMQNINYEELFRLYQSKDIVLAEVRTLGDNYDTITTKILGIPSAISMEKRFIFADRDREKERLEKFAKNWSAVTATRVKQNVFGSQSILNVLAADTRRFVGIMNTEKTDSAVIQRIASGKYSYTDADIVFGVESEDIMDEQSIVHMITPSLVYYKKENKEQAGIYYASAYYGETGIVNKNFDHANNALENNINEENIEDNDLRIHSLGWENLEKSNSIVLAMFGIDDFVNKLRIINPPYKGDVTSGKISAESYIDLVKDGTRAEENPKVLTSENKRSVNAGILRLV